MTAKKPIPGEVQLPGYETPEFTDTVQPLGEWWRGIADTDLDATLPKMKEYGAHDLVVVGEMLCHAMGWDDATLAQKTEVGVWFFLAAKVGRAFDALREHRLPSDDTVFDLRIYAVMAQRIRETGAWR